MTRPIIKEHNATTGEIVEREMDDAEFAKFEAEAAEYEATKSALEQKAIARAEILERLGLTAEEAAILLG